MKTNLDKEIKIKVEFLNYLKNVGYKIARIRKSQNLNKPSIFFITDNKENKEIIYLRYSKTHNNYIHWFGIEKKFLEELSKTDITSYIILLCGSVSKIYKIPCNFLLNKLKDTSVASDNNWKFKINDKRDRCELKIAKKEAINLKQFKFDISRFYSILN